MEIHILIKYSAKSGDICGAFQRDSLRSLVYKNKTAENTEEFMDRCFNFFPFYISHILTDNGLEFTNRLLVSKKGNKCTKLSKMDIKCQENEIEHRLIVPFTLTTIPFVLGVKGAINRCSISFS